MNKSKPKKRTQLKTTIQQIKKETYPLEDIAKHNTLSHSDYYTTRSAYSPSSNQISQLVHQNLEYKNLLRNNTKHPIENEITELKNQLDMLNMQTLKTKNKICVLIQLIRKYANKFLALSQSLSPSSTITTSTLIASINQFHNMIYNPKLNESLFDLSELVVQDSTDYIKEFSDLMQKYEDKIKLITEENNAIKQNIDKLNSDYAFVVKERDDYAKQLKAKNEEIDTLNKKCSQLEEDAKNKKNRIEELEALNNKQNTVDREIVFTGNKNDDDIAQYLDNNIEDSHINIGDDESILRMSSSRPKQIKKEIADLDVEITELRNQLKLMLKK